MKQCPMCGLEDVDEAAECFNCSYPFSSSKPKQKAEMEPQKLDDRPTGEGPMSVGWIFLALSILFSILAIMQSDRIDNSIIYYGGASASFSLFLVFWAVGYIVKAMSYLPRKDDL